MTAVTIITRLYVPSPTPPTDPSAVRRASDPTGMARNALSLPPKELEFQIPDFLVGISTPTCAQGLALMDTLGRALRSAGLNKAAMHFV